MVTLIPEGSKRDKGKRWTWIWIGMNEVVRMANATSAYTKAISFLILGSISYCVIVSMHVMFIDLIALDFASIIIIFIRQVINDNIRRRVYLLA